MRAWVMSGKINACAEPENCVGDVCIYPVLCIFWSRLLTQVQGTSQLYKYEAISVWKKVQSSRVSTGSIHWQFV